jgi:FeS assembly SUF system protein
MNEQLPTPRRDEATPSHQWNDFELNLIAALRTIYDPEIPVNIFDLGLIYAMEIDDDKNVEIEMTLTAPSCPVAAQFPATVEARLREVPDVNDVHVELVWDPPWSIDLLPEAVRLQLGLL